MGVLGRSGDGLRWPRFRLPRPTGIRNGGLLLVLVALAAVMAFVDEPPEPGLGRSLPGSFQHLPPPTGITALPPAVALPPAGGEAAATGADDGERPASADRAHPRRAHPRPARSVSAGRFKGEVTRPVGGGQSGNGGASPPPVTRPPATVPPVGAAPVARVRVPPVEARVRPPAVLGLDLPEVRVATPEVAVELPAS